MSVNELLILAFTSLISVQLIWANDLPILHPECNEYEDASEPTLLAYPNDCTKFYKCSGGYAFAMSCPQGLHWSVKYNLCEFPAEAGCNARDNEVLGTTSTTSPSVNGDEQILVVQCPVGESPNEPTHLPHPGDCSKFFKCIIGKAYPLNCPLGLHWSVVLNRCEWPEIAKCNQINATKTPAPTPATVSKTTAASTPTSAPTPARTSPPTPAPTSALTPASTPASTPAPTPAPNLSTTDLNLLCKKFGSAFFPYPGNCRRYIQCVNSEGKAHYCPSSLFYNSEKRVCTRTCG